MKLHIRTVDLKLKHPFTISRGTRTVIPSLIVELQSNEVSGYGEATVNPYYNTTIEKFVDDLEKMRPVIEAVFDLIPEEFWFKMYPHFKDNMFLLCALDEAYNDLYARKKGVKLYDLWGYKTTSLPQSNYTIGIDTMEKMTAKIKETPWPIYKIKLGTPNDLAIVRELRKHTNSMFRIDANCAWGVEETIENSKVLKALGVEFIEQPLQADDWEGAKEVFEKSHLPIVADESCLVESDVDRCKGYFHGINIKLMKCGGLTPAKRMVVKAKANKMKVMVGCMTESSVGISAIAHLTPQLDYVDMDGALLLSNDIAEGVRLEQGNIIFSSLNGTGVKLK